MTLDAIVDAIGVKPYFEEKCGVIYCGDCMSILPKIPDGCLNLLLTDPPYNINYKYDSYKDFVDEEDYFQSQLELANEIERCLMLNSSFIYLNFPEFAARMYWAVPEVCDLGQTEYITWIYNSHNGGTPLRKSSRVWIWMHKGTPIINSNALTSEYKNPDDRRVKLLIEKGNKPLDYDWWQYEQVKNVSIEKTEHPCQLPIEMVSKLIRASTNKGNIVIDTYLGSGTTAVAAKQLGRKYVGIEISEKYASIAVQRLQQEILL